MWRARLTGSDAAEGRLRAGWDVGEIEEGVG